MAYMRIDGDKSEIKKISFQKINNYIQYKTDKNYYSLVIYNKSDIFIKIYCTLSQIKNLGEFL